MGNPRTAVARISTAQEKDKASSLELPRADGWDALSTQKWLQLAGLAQRLSSHLNGLLALQQVAQSRID